MFLPFTIWAKDVPGITQAQLDAPTQCMCGKEKTLRECLAVWTHNTGKENYQYFAVCQPMCIVAMITEGSA